MRSGPLRGGVDGGGTGVRVAVPRGGGGVTKTGLRADRDLGRLASLLGATWRRRGWTRHSVAALVVASRAIWTERECRALARRLAGLARRGRGIPDAQAPLLAAPGGRPAVLRRARTGSVGLGDH